MGTAVLGQCWPTQAEALAAACAEFPKADGSAVLACTGVDPAGALVMARTTPEGATYFNAPIGGVPCDVPTFAAAPLYVSPADAALMAGAVLLVFGAGFAWVALQRVLSERDET